MGLRTFKGGVHPHEGKELSKDKPIQEYLPKGDLVYPVSQHIGAPARPIVAVGDTVKMGQMIAEAGGFVSAPIYATVSGTVKAIEPRRVVVGDMVNSIVIENDGEYNSVDFEEVDDISTLSKDEILEKIQKAGIVGMGGAGFPTHVKLSPKEPDKIDYVIANCAECEPYLTSDYRRMLEEPEKLIEGMRIILSLFDNAKGVFGIEDNKKDCIKLISEMVKDEPRMSVQPLRTKYPQGSERQLIYAITRRAINSTMLPADAGAIVDNVDTIVAIYKAVKLGMPLMHRIVTITGDAITNPANYSINIGTNYAELVDAAGGFKTHPMKIISGGPMMGFAMFSLDIPTTKTTSALLCMTEDEVQTAETQATNCINCGRCVEGCPSRIIPSRLADYAENHQEELFEKWNGLECVECGSCSYICPAKRNLVQAIRVMKKTVLDNKRKQA
ncbi:MAG: electron transport complex subunit RsxC [Lachnospiraceae bacterium]|nr:electron transport complex subunit RsxC [Lachnospiraceae bacterium]